MNERIKELIKQCTSQSEGSTWTSREEFDKEKFAKLIIRDCRAAINTEDTFLIAGPCDRLICEHFGVEE